MIAIAVVLALGAAHPLPADVVAYVARRDACDHWRGEEGYDAARAAEIARNVRAGCAGVDARLAKLRHRYSRDRRVRAALAGYETRTE